MVFRAKDLKPLPTQTQETTEKFKNYERLHDVPFTVYADFECS